MIPQLNRKLIERVNIGGTQAVLKACLAQNVTRLVYTSTYNVVFGGKEIRFVCLPGCLSAYLAVPPICSVHGRFLVIFAGRPCNFKKIK